MNFAIFNVKLKILLVIISQTSGLFLVVNFARQNRFKIYFRNSEKVHSLF